MGTGPGSGADWATLKRDLEENERRWKASATLAKHAATMEVRAAQLRSELAGRQRARLIYINTLTDQIAWCERQVRAASDGFVLRDYTNPVGPGTLAPLIEATK